MLKSLSDAIDDIPPIEQPMRYGNKAFKIWHKNLDDNIIDKYLIPILELNESLNEEQIKNYTYELRGYLLDSFGN